MTRTTIVSALVALALIAAASLPEPLKTDPNHDGRRHDVACPMPWQDAGVPYYFHEDPCGPSGYGPAGTARDYGQGPSGSMVQTAGVVLTDASRYGPLLGAAEGNVGPTRLRSSGEASVALANSSRGTAAVRIGDIPKSAVGSNDVFAIHYNSSSGGFNRIIRVADAENLTDPIPYTGPAGMVWPGGLGWTEEQAQNIQPFGIPESGVRNITTNKIENRGAMLRIRICLHLPPGISPGSGGETIYVRQGAFRASTSWLPLQMGEKVEWPLTSALGIHIPNDVPNGAVLVVEII